MSTNGVKLYNEHVTKEFFKYRKIRRIYCSDCDVEMEFSKSFFATFPAIYEYVCPKCNHKMTSTIVYPAIEEIWESEEDMKREVMD